MCLCRCTVTHPRYVPTTRISRMIDVLWTGIQGQGREHRELCDGMEWAVKAQVPGRERGLILRSGVARWNWLITPLALSSVDHSPA